jgi:hypothetical protein
MCWICNMTLKCWIVSLSILPLFKIIILVLDCTTHIPANNERYKKLVGKLIYLSHTCLDIAYAVSIVSQFMHCPSEEHIDVVTRFLRYLKGLSGRLPRF